MPNSYRELTITVLIAGWVGGSTENIIRKASRSLWPQTRRRRKKDQIHPLPPARFTATLAVVEARNGFGTAS